MGKKYVINRHDLTELKALARPPQMVVDVLSIACMLVAGDNKPKSWGECKSIMGDKTMFEKMLEIEDDPSILSASAVTLAETALYHLTVDGLRAKSAAAASSLAWAKKVISAPVSYKEKTPTALPKAQKKRSLMECLKSDVTELKSLAKTPQSVKEVLSVTCMLVTGDNKPVDWKDCQRIMGNPTLLTEKMTEIGRDPSILSAELLVEAQAALEPYNEENIKPVSMATVGILNWTKRIAAGEVIAEDPPKETPVVVKKATPEETTVQVETPAVQKELPPASLIDITGFQLRKGDLQELKAFTNPPTLVKGVLSIACMLILKEDRPVTWKVCQKMMKSSAMLKQMVDIGADPSVVPAASTALADVALAHITVEEVMKQSMAASSILAWAKRVVAGEVTPLEEKKTCIVSKKNPSSDTTVTHKERAIPYYWKAQKNILVA